MDSSRPNKHSTWRALLAAVAVLTAACSGGGDDNGNQPPAPPPPPPPNSVTLSGTAAFEFPVPNLACDGLDFTPIQTRPIRGATVEVIDATSNAQIASTTTDAAGGYSVSVGASRVVFVRIRSELKRTGSPSWDVDVRDNTLNTGAPLNQRPLYFLDSAAFNTGTANLGRNLTAGTGWDGSSFTGIRAAAPFAVLDSVYQMMQLVVLEGDATASFPALDVFWSPNNRATAGTGNLLADIDTGEVGTSFYIGGSLGSMVLLGENNVDADEFDDHIIAHEWGHYFEDRFSRSDSRGGSHTFGDLLDMRLAFGEGFGNAMSGIGLGNPVYCDSLWAGGVLRGFGFNVEIETSGPPGWYNEFTIARLLYDLWDADNDGADTMSIGFGPIYDVLIDEQATTTAFTTVFSFFEALKAQPNAETAFIDALLAQDDIVAAGIDAFAQGETNDANAGTDVLPVYTDIALSGTQQVCVSNQFNQGRFGSYLSNSRFLRFDLASNMPVTVTVDTVNPPTQPPVGFDCTTASAQDPEARTHSDPDFEIWREGQIVFAGSSCEPNQEIATSGTLAAGVYILELVDFRHDDPGTVTPGNFSPRVCFDVTIAP